MKKLYAFNFIVSKPNHRYDYVNQTTIAESMRFALGQIYQLYPDYEVTSLTRGNEVVQPQKFSIEATTPAQLAIESD